MRLGLALKAEAVAVEKEEGVVGAPGERSVDITGVARNFS
jgi:hypothetical protein